MPMAIIELVSPGPSAATMISASSRYGNASSTSTSRITTASTRPAKKPATSPMEQPSTSASPSATTTASSAVRVPNITRLNMSRPYWSAPNQWSADGGDRAADKSWSYGSNGANHPAATVSSRKTNVM